MPYAQLFQYLSLMQMKGFCYTHLWNIDHKAQKRTSCTLTESLIFKVKSMSQTL